MQYCTACQKAIATIVVMDLDEGSVSGSQHICTACAEQLGVTPPQQPKFSGEMLEDLLGGLKETQEVEAAPPPRLECCPGCGMTPSDFRQKGRLGCPRCYEAFRHELIPLLMRIHEAQAHAGRLPSTMPVIEADSAEERPDLSDLRQKLEDAVRGEQYEEAAQLRDELRRAERGEKS